MGSENWDQKVLVPFSITEEEAGAGFEMRQAGYGSIHSHLRIAGCVSVWATSEQQSSDLF